MPIYEFYCRKCNTIYNFFSKSANTDIIPLCPRCKRVKLQRQMSIFSKLSGKSEEQEDGVPHLEESRMQKAMEIFAREADRMDEDDPRQAAALMRKMTEATGLDLSSGMEEALSRLESGDDPDTIEEEMGDLLESGDPFVKAGAKSKTPQKKTMPQVDETLYDLE